MEIGDDGGRRDIQQGEQVVRHAAERLERLEVAHVADVLAHDRLVAAQHADRRLEFAADREHRRAVDGKTDRRGVWPRDRRMGSGRPVTHRTSESSQATRMSRSCTRNPSARRASRAPASSFSIAIGSSARLPDVITSGGRPEPRR